jgi:hypothetical protein
MSDNSNNIKNILKEYLEEIGINLVGALLLNNKGLSIEREIRADDIGLDDLEQIFTLVKPVIRNLIKETGSSLEKIKTFETEKYLLILTRVQKFVFLVSIFALDALIDTFLEETLKTSKKLAQNLEPKEGSLEPVEEREENNQKKFEKIEEKTENETEHVLRFYNCNYCKKTHEIKLPKNIIENKDQFPFPYVYLHSSIGDLRDLLTTLYIDKNLQIRGAEVIKVEDGDIFSEKLTRKITDKLMEQIAKLEEENLELRALLKNIDLDKVKSECADEDLLEEKTNAKKLLKLYVLSIVGKYEARKEISADLDDEIKKLKIKTGKLFNLNLNKFHLTYGGLILEPSFSLKHYDIISGEELVLIPARI